MPGLLDLPPEILGQIAILVEEEAESEIVLRLPVRSLPSRLFVCKRWCKVALPAYFANLSLK